MLGNEILLLNNDDDDLNSVELMKSSSSETNNHEILINDLTMDILNDEDDCDCEYESRVRERKQQLNTTYSKEMRQHIDFKQDDYFLGTSTPTENVDFYLNDYIRDDLDLDLLSDSLFNINNINRKQRHQQKQHRNLKPSNNNINANENSYHSTIKINDYVSVNDTKYGHVKYLGRVHFAYGFFCGIELDEPDGKHDGTIDNRRLVEKNIFTYRKIENIHLKIE